MAKDPSVLFYTQDFLIGSSLLTPIQKGHYITLLCHQHQSSTGSLRLDDVRKLLGKDFEKHWPQLKEKFKEDSSGFFNERMRVEIDKRSTYSKKQSERAAKGWQNRGNAVALPIIENENEIENSKKGGTGENKNPKWNKNPAEKEIEELQLTDMEIKASIEFIWHMKHVHTTAKDVQGYWKAFKIQQFTGGKNYADMARCLQHFRNWIKGQDISPAKTNGNVVKMKTKEELKADYEKSLKG